MRVKITKIDKAILQEDGSVFLDVEFDLLNGNKKVVTRKLAFPLSTHEKELEAELKKYARTFEEDEMRKIKNQKQEALDKQGDIIIQKYQGKTL